MCLEKTKHNLYWKTKLLKQATCVRYALAKQSKSVQISPLTSLDSFLQRVPCRKKRERSFWCKNKKRWCSNKRYQWVKIRKSHARKVTRNFEKWISKSCAVEAAEDSTKAHAYAIEANGWMQTESCRNRETDRHYKFPQRKTSRILILIVDFFFELEWILVEVLCVYLPWRHHSPAIEKKFKLVNFIPVVGMK